MCHCAILPTHGTVPLTTPTENVIIAAQKLISALKQPAHILEHNISSDHMTALETISKIFKNVTINKNKTTNNSTIEKQLPITQPTRQSIPNTPQPVQPSIMTPTPPPANNNPHIIPGLTSEMPTTQPSTH